MSLSRREFMGVAGVAGACAVMGTAAGIKGCASDKPVDAVGESTRRTLNKLEGLVPAENEDVLVRMQRELVSAMSKPVEQRRWVMVIDTRKCIGCDACTIGCVAENKLPPGVVYRPVVKEELGEYPNVQLHFTPRPCMQCENPTCTPVCPVKATWRRPDGITVVDYDKCIGCRYCITACPYHARTSDFGGYYTDGTTDGLESPGVIFGGAKTYENEPSHEYGKAWKREQGKKSSPKGNARKCHFCLHRLEAGQLPVCVTTCIGRATYFGDTGDPNSLVSTLVTHNRTQTLLTYQGTRPRVLYIL